MISVDSRQVYHGLDIGTGKDLTEYSMGELSIPYHLIDVNAVQEQFYLHDFVREAEAAFNKITARNHLPIFCGGTGLYLDALRKNFSFTKVPEQPALRADLEKFDKAELLKKLETYPAEFIKTVDRNSKKRIIRGIEIADFLIEHGPIQSSFDTPYKPLYIGITVERDALKHRIAKRLDTRLKSGLVEEVQGLITKRIPIQRLEELGLEYKFVSRLIKGDLNTIQMQEQLLTAIYQFSKRQMTWFRKMEKEGVEINWIDPDCDLNELVEKIQDRINE